jgi:UDP-glucuronate 4-epimerase
MTISKRGAEDQMRVLVTGAAGFIGCFTAEALLKRGENVVGFDNLNDYYDPSLKEDRLKLLAGYTGFSLAKGSLEDADAVRTVFERFRPERVIHLAAQAGVRHSINQPQSYIQSNIVGFLNVLEGCRATGVEHLVFASSSSVYGLNTKLPFSETDTTDSPANLYGATKKSNELMAYAYAHLYGVPATGLRFFTVYGPWGRPDMAPFIFTKSIFEGTPINVYNNGRHARDFTYISDAVEGVLQVLDKAPRDSAGPKFKIYNVGSNKPVQLMDFIACIERASGKTAIKNLVPLQPGDMLETYADIQRLAAATEFKPMIPIDVGVARLVDWYREYYSAS